MALRQLLKQPLHLSLRPKEKHKRHLGGEPKASTERCSAEVSSNESDKPSAIPSVPCQGNFCHITKLPLEVLLSVTDFLDAASHNTLRLACRQFQTALRCRSMSVSEETSFMEGIRRDFFHRNCELELHGLLADGVAMCSGCVRTHERSMFSAEALQKDPMQRRCLGYERKLRVCSHTSISLDELHAYLKDIQSWYELDISISRPYVETELCTHENHWPSKSPKKGCMPRLVVWPSGFGTPTAPRKLEVEIVRFYPLFPTIDKPFVVEDGTVSALHAGVCLAVSQCHRNACPHLNAARPFSLFRRKGGFSTTTVKRPTSSMGCHFPGKRAPAQTAEWKCMSRSCDTIIGLYHDATNELHLATRRRVGDLEDAMDPRWLSQLEIAPSDQGKIQRGFFGGWPRRNGKRMTALMRS